MKEVIQSGPVRIGNYIRTGHCSGCGECCKTGDPFNGEEGPAVIEGACPLLRTDGCSNKQHPYYLGGCIFFPQAPHQIADKPSCTYKFTPIE